MIFRTIGMALVIVGVILFESPGRFALAADVGAASADQAIASVSYQQMVSKTSELAAAGDVQGLAIHLQREQTNSDLNDADREKLLRETLLVISDVAPDNALRDTVRTLRAYPSKTYVWRDEHGHREKELLYDVAAAARFAEKRWDENESFRLASIQLNTARSGIVARYAQAATDDRKGIEKAFRSADLSALERNRPELLTAMRSGELVGPLSLIVAARLDDAGLCRAVIENADTATALDAIAGMRSVSVDAGALSLLEVAATRPDIRSAALLAIGHHVGQSAVAEDVLFGWLGQDGGASAATALARTGDPAVIDRLAQILNSNTPEMEQRHALLGLRLAQGERAAKHLDVFASDPGSPQALVREVR